MSSPTLELFRANSPSAASLNDDDLTLKIYDLTRDNPLYDSDKEFLAQAQALDTRRAFGSAATSFGRGVTGMVGSIPEAVGIPLKQVTNLTGIPLGGESLIKVGHAIQDIVPPLPEGTPTGFLRTTLPAAAGSMLGFMGGGAIGQVLKIPKALAIGGLGAMAQGTQGYDEAIAKGATEGTAFKSYLLNLPVGASEILPLASMLDRFDKATAGTFSKALFTAFKEGTEEGLQEFFQQPASNLIAKQLYDENQQVFDGAAEQGAAGGLLGFAASLIVSAAGGHLKAPRTATTQAPPPPTAAPVFKTAPEPPPPITLGAKEVVVPPGTPTTAARPATAGELAAELDKFAEHSRRQTAWQSLRRQMPSDMQAVSDEILRKFNSGEPMTAHELDMLKEINGFVEQHVEAQKAEEAKVPEESPKQPVNPEDLGLIVSDYLNRMRPIPNLARMGKVKPLTGEQTARLEQIKSLSSNPTAESANQIAALFNLQLDPTATEMPTAFSHVERPMSTDATGMLPGDTGLGMRAERRLIGTPNVTLSNARSAAAGFGIAPAVPVATVVAPTELRGPPSIVEQTHESGAKFVNEQRANGTTRKRWIQTVFGKRAGDAYDEGDAAKIISMRGDTTLDSEYTIKTYGELLGPNDVELRERDMTPEEIVAKKKKLESENELRKEMGIPEIPIPDSNPIQKQKNLPPAVAPVVRESLPTKTTIAEPSPEIENKGFAAANTLEGKSKYTPAIKKSNGTILTGVSHEAIPGKGGTRGYVDQAGTFLTLTDVARRESQPSTPALIAAPAELTPTKPTVEGIGSVYQSTHNGKPVWLVQEGLKRGFGDSIWQSEQEANDQAKRVAMRESQRAESLKRGEAQKLEEARISKEKADFGGFEEGKTPMQVGRLVSSLSDKQVNWNGIISSRRDAIKRLVESGRTIEVDSKGKRRLIDAEGRFFGEDQVSKLGMDYAEHLIAKRDAKPTTPKPEAPKGETAAKEPWQYTKSEWSAKIKSEYGRQGFPDLAAKQSTDATHRTEVERAIKDGKPVPVEVLADYPDIAKPSAPPAAASSAAIKTAAGVEPKAQGVQYSIKSEDGEFQASAVVPKEMMPNRLGVHIARQKQKTAEGDYIISGGWSRTKEGAEQSLTDSLAAKHAEISGSTQEAYQKDFANHEATAEPIRSAIGEQIKQRRIALLNQVLSDRQASGHPAIWIDDQVITESGKYTVKDNGTLAKVQDLSKVGFERNLMSIEGAKEGDSFFGMNAAAKARMAELIAERDAADKAENERRIAKAEADNATIRRATEYRNAVDATELPKPKKTTIQKTALDEKKEVVKIPQEATVYGDFAIHKTTPVGRDKPSYVVTHVPSGMAILPERVVGTLGEAKRFVQAMIHSGADLSAEKPSAENLKKASDAVRFFRNGGEPPSQPPKPTERQSKGGLLPAVGEEIEIGNGDKVLRIPRSGKLSDLRGLPFDGIQSEVASALWPIVGDVKFRFIDDPSISAAGFNGADGVIFNLTKVSGKPNFMLRAILHEAVHAATYTAIRDPLKSEQVSRLSSLMGLSAQKWHFVPKSEMTEGVRLRFEHALKNVDEFVSAVLTDRKFQRFLGDIKATDRNQITGKTKSFVGTLLQKAWDAIAGLVGIRNGTVLSESLSLSEQLLTGEKVGRTLDERVAMKSPEPYPGEEIQSKGEAGVETKLRDENAAQPIVPENTQVAKIWNSVVGAIRMAGIPVSVLNTAIGKVQAQFRQYANGDKLIVTGMNYQTGPTSQSLADVLHEGGHALWSLLPQETQDRLNRALGSPVIIRTQAATGATRIVAPSEETIVENTAQAMIREGFNPTEAKGYAQQLWRFIKDLFQRLAMATQEAMFGRASQNMAEAYFQNQMESWLAGDHRPFTLTEFLGGGRPRPENIATALTSANGSGILNAIWDADNQRMVYPDVLMNGRDALDYTAKYRWQDDVSGPLPVVSETNTEADQKPFIATTNEVSTALNDAFDRWTGRGNNVTSAGTPLYANFQDFFEQYLNPKVFPTFPATLIQGINDEIVKIGKQPVDPVLRISGINEASGQMRAATQALGNLRQISAEMADRRRASGQTIKANEGEIKRTARQANRAATNYTNVQAVVDDARDDMDDMLRRFRDDIRTAVTTSTKAGELGQAIEGLIENVENPLSQLPNYASAIENLYKKISGESRVAFEDMLRTVANLNLPWDTLTVRQLRTMIEPEIQRNPLFAPLRTANERTALIGILIAFGKRNGIVMDYLQLSAVEKGIERDAINEALKAALADSRTALDNARRLLKRVDKNLPLATRLLDRLETLRARNLALVQENQRLQTFVEFHDQDLVPAMDSRMRPMEEIIGAQNFSWEPVQGATVQVPLKPNSTIEEVMAATSTQTLNLRAGERIPADVEHWMKRMRAWLDEYALNHPGEKGVVWNDMNLRLEKLTALGIDPEVRRVKGSFVIDLLGSIRDKLDRIGLPVTRELAKRMAWLDVLHIQHGRDRQIIGTKWDGAEALAFKEANRTVKVPFTLETFRRLFFHPALKLAEDRKDISEVSTNQAADESATLQAIHLMFLGNPQTRSLINSNVKLWPSLEQFYRMHWKSVQGSFKVLQDMNRTVGSPIGSMIQDDVLGLFRKPIGNPIHTSPRMFRKEINLLYDAMKPLWVDGYAPNQAALQGVASKLSGEFDADPTAMAQRLQTLFTRQVWNDFVKEIVEAPRSKFDAPTRADGTTPTAQRANVLNAYRTAGGDVMAFIDNLSMLESGQHATAEFVGETLSTFHAFFNIIHGIFQDLEKAKNARVENPTQANGSDIDHFLMDSRKSEALPAGFLEYATFGAYDMQRIFQRFAEHAAFGRNATAVWQLFAAARNEMQDTITRYNALKEEADTKGQTKKERDDLLTAALGGKEARAIAEQAAANITVLSSTQTDFENIIKTQATSMVQLKAVAEILAISPGAAVQGFGTVLMDHITYMNPLRQLGFSSQGLQMVVDMTKAGAVRTFGSFMQVFGIQIKMQAEKAKMLADQGFTDSDAVLTLKEKVISIIHSTQDRSDIGKVSKGAIIFSRAIRTLLSTGVPQIFKTDVQLYPTLKPAVFTFSSQVMQGSSILAVIDGYERMITRAAQFMRADPTVMDDPTFRFQGADLGYKKGWLLNDEFAFDVMRDGFERQGVGSLENVTRDTIRRQDAAPPGTTVPVMTREQLTKVGFIGPNEITQDATLSNRPTWMMTNAILRNMTTLLGWSMTNFNGVVKAFREPSGESSYRAARKGLVAFAALIPIGIAFAMLRDEYDERVLGKKSNVLGLGQGNNALAVIDMLDRAGLFGIGGNLVNGLVNQDINREFSLDSRVFFASSLLNTGRALSTWVRQDEATWGTVYRPLINGLGGSGFLQYADAINHAMSLDNEESRAVARISVNNYLRAVGRSLELDVRVGKAGGVISNAVKPWVAEMQMAAYSNDMAGFAEAYKRAVQAATEAKFPDPADHVKRSYSGINPLRSVFQTMPSEAEYRNILNALPADGRDAVQSAILLYNRFGERIGLKPSFGKEEKPPPLKLPNIRSRAALSFAGF